MLRARLARFYRWSDKEIGSMTVARVNKYAECIESIIAQEALAMLPIVTFPHMKKDKAKGLEKKLRKTASSWMRKEAPKSTEDLYNHLIRTLGNG